MNLSNLPNFKKNINKLIKKYKVPDIMVNYDILKQKTEKITHSIKLMLILIKKM